MYYVWDNFLEDVFDYRGGGGIWLRAPEEEDRFYLTAEVYTDSPNGRFSTTVVNGIFPVEPFAKFASRWDLLPGRVVIPGKPMAGQVQIRILQKARYSQKDTSPITMLESPY